MGMSLKSHYFAVFQLFNLFQAVYQSWLLYGSVNGSLKLSFKVPSRKQAQTLIFPSALTLLYMFYEIRANGLLKYPGKQGGFKFPDRIFSPPPQIV